MMKPVAVRMPRRCLRGPAAVRVASQQPLGQSRDSDGYDPGFVIDGGMPISGAELSLTGPGVTLTANSGANGFTFGDLPPGSYTLTVVLPGFVCQPLPRRWRGESSRPMSSAPNSPQAGDCPPLLPEDNAIRSIGFDSTSGTLSIRGLDPALTIAGTLTG